jgi:hypothetical protein
MIDYRLFYPKISLQDQARARRPILGHGSERVYQLPSDRRADRQTDRR